MEQDFIDITPTTMGGTKQKRTVFQETEWAHIRGNPEGLTKEGVLKKIELWKKSNNRQVETKYRTMLAQCEKITESGKTSKGEIIFARRPDGSAYWIDEE